MAGSDACIDPLGCVKDLADIGEQTPADKASLIAYQELSSTSVTYPWGDIRGHNGSSMSQDTNSSGIPFKVHGPEVGFVRSLYAAGWHNIAIIKVSDNYSVLENGRSAWVSPNSRWRDWTAFVDAQLAELSRKGYAHTIRGVVWSQGIDDGMMRRSQADYQSDLQQIVSDIRARYGDIPFVLERDSEADGADRMDPIRAAQVEVATTTPNSGWIDVDDLCPYVNTHHLSEAAQLTAGERFAAAYLSAKAP
jgi:hypothetical protein